MQPFSASARSYIFQKCEEENPDLIIVGGGITGAGIVMAASRRGLRAVLFEKGDFASGTSGASSKLVHGGLRYLETFDLGLVFESTRERKRLIEIAPSLVKPLAFFVPSYKGQRRGLLTVYIGTWIYYFLALFRNIGRPKIFSAHKTLKFIPKLAQQLLRGSVRYFDAATVDSRLTLSAIKTGCQLGASACNHAKVIEYIREDNQIVGVKVEDQISKKQYEVRSKWTINAVGPWTDTIRKEISAGAQKTMRLTKGAHLIVEGNPFSIEQAILMLSPVDGRVVFLIPWCGHTMIGTTDDDYQGNPEQVRVDKKDQEYLLSTVSYYFPSVSIASNQILSRFAGLRCLREENKANPSDVSREHLLFSEIPGLLTIAGGKLTTFVSMGEEVIDWLVSKETVWKSRAHTIISKLEEVKTIEHLNNPTEKIFEYLIDHEMAVTVRDLLQYRTLSYYLTKDHGSSLIDSASRAIKTRLRLSDEEIARQITEYKSEIEKQHADFQKR